MKYIYTLLLLGITLTAFSQDVEDEIGFVYLKAEYLLETQRYADAIKQYGEVIRKEPGYKDALIKRAMAKYEMASFRGVKEDLINYIKLKGASMEATRLLALTDYKQGNHEAALNSLNTLMACGSSDSELFYVRGECYLALDAFEDACGNWQKAASMGHNTASLQSNKYCRDIVANTPNSGPRPRPDAGTASPSTQSKPTQSGPITKPTKPSTNPNPTKPGTRPSTSSGTSGTGNTQIPTTPPVEDEVVITKPTQPVDNSVNEIVVDEDLTLVLKNGIGGRKLLQQPNILILADEGGIVAIDIVVNDRGRVDSAEFNASNSTLNTQSIISLAIRKSKEFWFEKSEWPETRGTIVFRISGR